MRKSFITFVPIFFLLICSFPSFGGQAVVELKTQSSCSSDQASRNKTVLTNAIRSNTMVQLPAGKFNTEPFSITGVDNLTLIGAGDGSTIETKVEFTSGGLSLSNVTNMRLENIEIQGSASTTNLLVLSDAGALSAENLYLTTSDDVASECLQPNLDWLVPVISLILD